MVLKMDSNSRWCEACPDRSALRTTSNVHNSRIWLKVDLASCTLATAVVRFVHIEIAGMERRLLREMNEPPPDQHDYLSFESVRPIMRVD